MANDLEKAPDVCGYTHLTFLGKGAYGIVTEVVDGQSGLYALKYVVNEPNYAVFGWTDFAEIDLLSRLDHPHLLHLVKIITNQDCPALNGIGLLLPLADQTVGSFMKNVTRLAVDRLAVLYKLATGLAFMHDNHALHLDVAAKNALLQGNRPYFADFGLSMLVDDTEAQNESYHRKVTIIYRPPELLQAELDQDIIYVSNKTDVWSFGILCIEVLLGAENIYSGVMQTDFESEEMLSLINAFFGDDSFLSDVVQEVAEDVRAPLLELLSGMLKLDPAQRISMNTVVNHPAWASVRDHLPKPITGNVLDSRINTDYDPSHRETLKLLFSLAAKITRNFDAEVLFLTIDLYNRVGAQFKGQPRELLLAATTALWMAPKILLRSGGSIRYILQETKKIANTTFTPAELLAMEIKIVRLLKGMLYVMRLYHACKNVYQLRMSLRSIVLDRDSTVYARVDIPAWIALLDQQPESAVPGKKIGINKIIGQ